MGAIRFKDGAPFLQLDTMALVGMSAAGKDMGDQERKRVAVSESAPALQPRPPRFWPRRRLSRNQRKRLLRAALRT